MATDGVGRTGGSLAIDDLIVLNDEIAALVRAGVPLERGLLEVGRDVRGRLGASASAIGSRMADEGRSLPEAIDAEAGRLPKLYAAVVTAGIRAGRLPAALEGLAGFARGLAELRRMIGLALLYPMIVAAFAYGMFVAFVVLLAPRFEAAFDAMGVSSGNAAAILARIGAWWWLWAPIGPVLLVVAILAWAGSGRASTIGLGRAGSPFGRLPGIGGLLEQARAALLADLLALLIEHHVPMPDAMVLAVRAFGDHRAIAHVEQSAEEARLGAPMASVFPPGRPGPFPPMVRWLLATANVQPDLVGALRHAAASYRDRAHQHAAIVRVVLPMVLLVVIGGTSALLLVVALFAPMAELLQSIG